MFGFIKNNPKFFEILAVVVLLLFFAGQIFFSISQKSLTTDESLHIGAGYSYLKTWNPIMNPEHPPFLKMWGALPLLFLNLDGKFESKEFLNGSQRDYGQNFVYNNRINYKTISLFARTNMIILGIIFGIYIFIWAKELFGIKAGLAALTLYSFNPTVLANSGLVTTDLGVALFIFITSYYYFKLLKEKKWKYAVLSGIFLGLAQVSKFIAAYMAPFLILITLIQIFVDLRKSRACAFFVPTQNVGTKKAPNTSLKKRILWLAAVLFIAFIVIWLFYLLFGKPYFSGKAGIFFLMPYHYTKGAEIVLIHTQEGHKSFFFGKVYDQGWWYYYIVSFLIKEPFAFLALIFGYFFLKILKMGKLNKAHFTLYLLPLFILLWSSFLNKANIGIRHILPIYPFLFVFTSDIINVRFEKQVFRKVFYIILTLLFVWYIGNSLWIFPDYLMHFNQFVGGPDGGWRYSVVSDDWGQDDIGLVRWMEKNGYSKFNFLPLSSGSYEIVQKEAIDKKIEVISLVCNYEKNVVGNFKTGSPVAIHISSAQRESNPNCFENLLKIKPMAKIGYSIFIYDFKKQGINMKEFKR